MAAMPALASTAAKPGISLKQDVNYKQWLASASVDDQGQHWLVVMDKLNEQKLAYALPARAHQVLKHPTKPWLFVAARRPGQYVIVVDILTGQLVKNIAPAPDQYFCGHMLFSEDGRYLYTTENISASSDGQVVARDLDSDFKVLTQWPSGGLGPHQMKFLADRKTLVIANGGIHTLGREKLNLNSMKSNLSYLDIDSGKLVEQVALPADLSQLSIRHIDVNHHGDVLIAMQHQGDKTDLVPLVAVHNMMSGLHYLEIADNDYFSLKHYCGSACFDQSGACMAISAPRGDSVLFWDTHTQQFLGKYKVRDGCGLAATSVADEFVISSGQGKLYHLNPRTGVKKLLSKSASMHFDNHLASIS